MEAYKLGYKYGDEIVYPEQESTPIMTKLSEKVLKQLYIERGKPDGLVIYRSKMQTKFLSQTELDLFKNSKCDTIMVINDTEEFTIFNKETIFKPVEDDKRTH